MRAFSETQDLVVKLRNENAELRGIINDVQNEIGHLREQLHETRLTVQRLSMEVPTGIGPVKNAVLQEIVNNSRQRDKTQCRWNTITICLADACLTTCSAASRLFKGMAILPSVSLLHDKFQGVVAEQEKWLMDTTDIKYLVQKWRTKDDIREDLMIDVNLRVDAASCKPELFSSEQRCFGGIKRAAGEWN
jgi:hypothetical protein